MNCWICDKQGAEETRHYTAYENGATFKTNASSSVRCYCPDCLKIVERQDKADLAEYIRLHKRMMFNRAVQRLESQGVDMYEYREAINAVDEFITEKPDKFDSSYEVLAAIVLVQNRIQCSLQHKIGRYQVDFLLPLDRVVLEIDGERHKHRKDYDTARDRDIKKKLGPGWHIIRIPTEMLDQHADRLPKAIERVTEYRETGRVNWREI